MRQGLGNGQIRVVKLNVFAAERDFYRFVAGGNPFEHFVPLGQVDNSGVEFKPLAHHFGKIALFEHYGALI